MKLVLCTRPRNISSWFLRFLLWSKWSHSAIYDEELGVVHDTTFSGGGCKATLAEEFFKHYPLSHCEFRPINILPIRMVAARQWLSDQIGKKYDWTALLSWIVRRDWQEDDRWFCSEETETFISLFDRQRFVAKMSRVTPQHQAMLL